MVLLVLTVAAAEVDLGQFNVVIAVFIAVVKAVLIILYFMRALQQQAGVGVRGRGLRLCLYHVWPDAQRLRHARLARCPRQVTRSNKKNSRHPQGGGSLLCLSKLLLAHNDQSYPAALWAVGCSALLCRCCYPFRRIHRRGHKHLTRAQAKHFSATHKMLRVAQYPLMVAIYLREITSSSPTSILPTSGLTAMNSNDILRIGNDGSTRYRMKRSSFISSGIPKSPVNQSAIDVDFDIFIVVVAHTDFSDLSGGDFTGVKGAAQPDVACPPHRSQFTDAGCVGSKSAASCSPF